MSKSLARTKRASKVSKSKAAAVVDSSKHFQQADTAKNRSTVAENIQRVAAKLRKDAKAKLSLADVALCFACKFRTKLAKKLTVDAFFEMLNSETRFKTHKSSTYVSKHNAQCKRDADRLLDARFAVYQVTVALYDSASQFAAEFVCFAFDCSISQSKHSSSNKLSHRLTHVETCKVVEKVARQKALASDVAVCASYCKK